MARPSFRFSQDGERPNVRFHLRDIQQGMVDAWKKEFADCDNVSISCGDIFEGAPAADAIVSPANSFGFMDGGIDMNYSLHFGWQMQDRLQEKIREECDGENPVGQALIIPTVMPRSSDEQKVLATGFNEGRLIRHLISAPTMRVPCDVSETPNAYLAFRAVLRAVKEHNQSIQSDNDGSFIKSVLCPGMGTAVGRMPFVQCAHQMRVAYGASWLKNCKPINNPSSLVECTHHHHDITTIGEGGETTCSKEKERGELFLPKKQYT